MKRVAVCLFAVLSSVSLAQVPAAKPEAGRFALTVYSTADPATFDPQGLLRHQSSGYGGVRPPGYGVVREVRKIDLNEGENIIRFTDVASGIDPTSVAFLSLTDPAGTSVIEQSYEYDLVSGEKMLDKYRDRQVTVTIKGSGSSPGQVVEGKLLSADYQAAVIQQKDGSVTVAQRQEIGSVHLAKQDTNLITKPTLVWKLRAARKGAHDVQITYQTDNLTWRADYNVVLNEKDTAADVGAWVTLLNQSGATYPDARLKLVAGDVHRLPRDPDGSRIGTTAGLFGGRGGGGGDDGFKEKSFFEYHLYTLGRPSTVGDNATKQIELFPLHENVAVEKVFLYYGLPDSVRYSITPRPITDSQLGTQMNKKVDVYVSMQNSEKNGLGLPLPAGRVRVFKRDQADDYLEFVGEDVIQHTPRNEKALFRIGQAFDIVGERKQLELNVDHGEFIDETVEIKLRNHKAEAVKVIVKENLYRWVNWEIREPSDKFEKQDFRTIHFTVDVPAGGEKTIKYKVHYTW